MSRIVRTDYGPPWKGDTVVAQALHATEVRPARCYQPAVTQPGGPNKVSSRFDRRLSNGTVVKRSTGARLAAAPLSFFYFGSGDGASSPLPAAGPAAASGRKKAKPQRRAPGERKVKVRPSKEKNPTYPTATRPAA